MTDEKAPDQILQELWDAKDSYSRQFDGNLDRMVEDLRRRQRESGREFVNIGSTQLKKIASE